MRNLLVAAAFALPLTFALSSHAEQLGTDEVVLKNGGSIRGSVISVEPGQKVVLLEMGKREPREIPWAEVADVEKGKFGDGKPTKDARAEEEDDEPSGGKGRVKLHIESDEPVQVFERVGAAAGAVGGYGFVMESFKEVCASPCDREIDGSRGQAFFVAGDGVPGSEAFYLGDKTGSATLNVDTGSSAQIWGGATLVTLGGVAVLSGAVMLPLGVALDDATVDGNPFVTAGAVTLGVGAAVLAGGIVLLATGGTDVEWGEHTKAARIDGRPREVKPRYWLGEF